ncbi:MAG: DUF4868 domain-containing protein [Opitutaceae bacterium]
MTLWIVYKRRNFGEAAKGKTPADNFHFGVRRLDTAKELQSRLAGVVQETVEKAKRLERYTFEGAVEAETALVEKLDDTAFKSILDLVSKAGPEDLVKTEKHLHAAYGYLIQIQPTNQPSLFAFRRVQTTWKVKKLTNLINALFKEKTLITANEEKIFRFDRKIDFFANDGVVFILDKSGFENALNFRVGMERKRDELIQNLETTQLYLNLDLVKSLSTTHVRWLKKLAGAHSLGKCLDPKWVQQLLVCCKDQVWPVKEVGGKIEITPENCELIVRLMNYDLLQSPVDHALFKIDGAKEAL